MPTKSLRRMRRAPGWGHNPLWDSEVDARPSGTLFLRCGFSQIFVAILSLILGTKPCLAEVSRDISAGAASTAAGEGAAEALQKANWARERQEEYSQEATKSESNKEAYKALAAEAEKMAERYLAQAGALETAAGQNATAAAAAAAAGEAQQEGVNGGGAPLGEVKPGYAGFPPASVGVGPDGTALPPPPLGEVKPGYAGFPPASVGVGPGGTALPPPPLGEVKPSYAGFPPASVGVGPDGTALPPPPLGEVKPSYAGFPPASVGVGPDGTALPPAPLGEVKPEWFASSPGMGGLTGPPGQDGKFPQWAPAVEPNGQVSYGRFDGAMTKEGMRIYSFTDSAGRTSSWVGNFEERVWYPASWGTYSGYTFGREAAPATVGRGVSQAPTKMSSGPTAQVVDLRSCAKESANGWKCGTR